MKQKANKTPIAENQDNKSETNRRANNSFDDAYINAYCNNPMAGKKAALIEAGFVGEHIAQEAYRMHGRLKDQIKARTDQLIDSLDTLAATQLLNILSKPVDEVGYANMNKSIQQGLDYAGRKPGDVLTIKKEATLDDIDNHIEQLQKELSETEGKDLH